MIFKDKKKTTLILYTHAAIYSGPSILEKTKETKAI